MMRCTIPFVEGTSSRKALILVDMPYRREKDQPVSIGHASLLASLKRYPGIDTRSIVFPNPTAMDTDRIAQRLFKELALWENPDQACIGIGVYLWNDLAVREILPTLRVRGFDGRIILGGPQISFLETGRPEREYPEADLFIRGHAEEALPNAVLSGTAPNEFSSVDLADLPSPIMTGVLPLPPGGFIHLETQRGCLFRCSFCQHRDPTIGGSPQRFVWSRIRDEIHAIADSGVADIKIVDPIFHHGSRDAIRILREFKQLGYRGKLACECRFETIRDGFLDVCDGLNILLEFGLQTAVEREWKAINRPNNLRKIDETIRRLQARRLRFSASVIYGLPLQTMDSFYKTLAYCRERNINRVEAFPLCVYPGTELERTQNRWGLKVALVDGLPTVVESSTMSQADISEIGGKFGASSKLSHRTSSPGKALVRKHDDVGSYAFRECAPGVT